MTFVRNNQTEKSVVEKKVWRVAVYLRLSKEDGDKPESDSIQNQRSIIDNHIKFMQSQGDEVVSVDYYSDDGYSGGTFSRPGYERMIRDIEAELINCVIFKDNSRLGRNYPELGRLMEDYFPSKKVRVISVLNHIDSYKDPYSYSSAIVSFSNIMNDDYIRQLSIKIKSTFAMKRAKGEFLGNYAPYGYMKSPEDHHKLIIDPEAAEVVRMIFDWYTQGLSASRIVKELNALGICPPSVYKTNKGIKGFTHHSSGGVKRCIWSLTSINTMLKDEVYIGNMVQGKNRSESYRTKRMVPTDESEWTVIEGTHEPIISFNQFSIVHDRFSRHTRVAPENRQTYLLSGLIQCAHCGAKMNRYISSGVARYRCMTRTYAKGKCSCSSVKEEYLEKVILEVIQKELRELVDAKKVIEAARDLTAGRRAANQYDHAIKKALLEIDRIKQKKFRLFDSLQNGVISEDEFRDYRERYDGDIEAQNKSIEQLKKAMEEAQRGKRQDDEFISIFKKYGTIRSLDRDLINQLIDHVEFTDAKHIAVFCRYEFIAEKQLVLDYAKTLQTPKNGTVC